VLLSAKQGIIVLYILSTLARLLKEPEAGDRLRRDERRWLVERFFAWIQWQRRLFIRWEYYAENFLGFVQPASIAALLKQF
jgi:hypothetical protein